MCVNPIRIKNPRLKGGTFDPEFHPLYLTVPCGHCYECCLSRQNNWYVRNYFQFKETQKTGVAYYYTLTYNDAHLIRLGGYISKNIRVFDKDNVRKFIYRLSQRLRRKNIKLSYFLVSEYGTNFERPHHHVIFYCSSYIAPVEFSKMVLETWNNGFVRAGNNFGVVSSLHALNYVTKYLTKGTVQKPFISPLNIVSHAKLANYLSRKFGTFILVSSGFGKSGLQSCSNQSFVDGFLQIPQGGKYRKVPLPSYYVRKLVYQKFINSHGNTCYKLSSKGFDLLKKRFFNIFDSIERKCYCYNSSVENSSSLLVTPELVLDMQLGFSMPLRKHKITHFGMYWHRYKLGSENKSVYTDFERYYPDSNTLVKYHNFLRFISKQSFLNYQKRVDSYNVNQRVLYKHPKIVKKLSYYEYIAKRNKLESLGSADSAFSRHSSANSCYSSVLKPKIKRKVKLCVLIRKCALPFLPPNGHPTPF